MLTYMKQDFVGLLRTRSHNKGIIHPENLNFLMKSFRKYVTVLNKCLSKKCLCASFERPEI